MLVACWSAKGGSGTTVVSVALAGLLARTGADGALLADLAGDVPTALGLPEPSGPGLAAWLDAGDDVPADALAHLEVDGPGGIAVLPLGGPGAPAPAGLGGPSSAGGVPGASRRGEVLAALLAADVRPVVADCGSGPAGDGLAVAAAASVSLLVLRPCFLALKRAVAAPLRPTAVVLVEEPGRALGALDVEEALGVEVRARLRLDPAVARAVDAGLFPGRMPRGMQRALRHVA